MFKTISQSWRLLSRRHKARLSFLTIVRVLLSLLDIAAIALLGILVSFALDSGANVGLLGSIFGLEEGSLLGLLWGVVFLFSSKTLLGLYLNKATVLYLATIEADFSMQAATYLLGKDLMRLRELSKPEIEWAVLRSSQKAFTGILGNAITYLSEFSFAVMVFLFLFVSDWQLALFLTAYFGIILGAFQLYTRRTVALSGEEYASGSVAVNNAISDAVGAFRELTVADRMNFLLGKLGQARRAVAAAEARYQYLGAVPRLIVELGLIIGAIAVVSFEFLVGGGGPEFGKLGVFLLGGLRMMSALLPLQRAFQYLRFEAPSAHSAQHLIAELQASVALGEGGEATQSLFEIPSRSEPVGGVEVQFSGVSFTYLDGQTSVPAVSEVTFQIEKGTLAAFVGPSGAGKSTVIDLILGLLEPSDGKIFCNGVLPRDFRTTHVGKVGYVPQKPGVVSGSVSDNVALGLPPAEVDVDDVWRALELAGLADLIRSLPDGQDTNLGSHLDALSGGQLQRLGLARALYTRPSLLVLDEATSALDADTEASIVDNLELLKGQTTLIVVAHRISTIQGADQILVLDDGKLVGEGSFQFLRRNNSIFRRYVELLSFQKD